MAITKRTFENWDGTAEAYIREHFEDRDAAQAVKVQRMVIKKEFVGLDSDGNMFYRFHHKGEAAMMIRKAYTDEVYS